MTSKHTCWGPIRRDPLHRGLAAVLLLSGAIAGRAWGASAGDTLHLSLEECVESALSLGEELRLAEAQLATARALYLQARSTALPQITLSATYTRQVESIFRQGAIGVKPEPFSPDTLAPLDQRVRDIERALPTAALGGLADLIGSSPFGSLNTWVASLSFSQKLLQGGAIWAAIAAAGHAMRSAEEAKADKREEVILLTREAYLAALLADRAVQIAQLGLDQAESQLTRVRLRQEAGQASQFELLQAEVQRDNLVPAVTQARNLREVSYLEVRRLVNLHDAQPVALTTPLLDDIAVPEEPLAVDTAGLEEAALRASGVVALEEVVEARDHAVRVAGGDRWPGLSLFANSGRQAFPAGLLPEARDWRNDVSVGLRLNWSLFDGFLTRGAVQESKAKAAIARYSLNQAREAARQTVVLSRGELERAAADLHGRARTVQLARRALELANLRYEEGASSLLEVADARIAYQMAQTNEAWARHDYFVALARLERYTGRPLFTAVAGALGAER